MEELKIAAEPERDISLLGEAITEMNISRHNVSVYPKDHPIVEASLTRAHDLFEKLFLMNECVTLAVTKDVIMVHGTPLDKKHPVYKDFAQHLNRINIAKVNFTKGMTKDELYAFHGFLLAKHSSSSSEYLETEFKKCGMHHINAEFINYSAFRLVDDDSADTDKPYALWEKYIHGLIDGTLQTEDVRNVLKDVTSEQLAHTINTVAGDKMSEGSYDRVITSYVTNEDQRIVNSKNLAKLIHCVQRLRPDIKRQFLDAALSTMSRDLDSLDTSLNELSEETLKSFLQVINEKMVIVPESLKNVLDKFVHIKNNYDEASHLGGSLIEDDILLSPEVTSLLHETNFKSFVSNTYQQEIQKMIRHEVRETTDDWIRQYAGEWRDEHINRMFHRTMLEFYSPENIAMIAEEEYVFMKDIMVNDVTEFVETGQYEEVIQTLSILQSTIQRPELNDFLSDTLQYFHSKEFLLFLINSLRIFGRQMREEALQICEYYGAEMVPYLLDVLVDEESPAVRRFMISLITHLGERAMPEVVRRLKDSRWYVKRNMLFILLECGSDEDLKKAKPYTRHENPKVSLEAVKCLVKAKDHYGIQCLRGYLSSESKEIIKKAVSLAGSYRVNAVVQDLGIMLRNKIKKSSDVGEKIHVARALGQIGGADAVRELKKALEKRSFFFRNSVGQLKQEIRSILERTSEQNSGASYSNNTMKTNTVLSQRADSIESGE